MIGKKIAAKKLISKKARSLKRNDKIVLDMRSWGGEKSQEWG